LHENLNGEENKAKTQDGNKGVSKKNAWNDGNMA
jgi:hypothetical protein